jgi:hypothetical protein
MWRSGHTDLARLLQNTIRWVSRGARPVRVEGDGAEGADDPAGGKEREEDTPPKPE